MKKIFCLYIFLNVVYRLFRYQPLSGIWEAVKAFPVAQWLLTGPVAEFQRLPVLPDVIRFLFGTGFWVVLAAYLFFRYGRGVFRKLATLRAKAGSGCYLLGASLRRQQWDQPSVDLLVKDEETGGEHLLPLPHKGPCRVTSSLSLEPVDGQEGCYDLYVDGRKGPAVLSAQTQRWEHIPPNLYLKLIRTGKE